MVAPLATMHVAMVIVVARGLKTKLRPRVVHSRLSFDSLDRCLTMVLTLAIFIYVYFFFFFFFCFNHDHCHFTLSLLHSLFLSTIVTYLSVFLPSIARARFSLFPSSSLIQISPFLSISRLSNTLCNHLTGEQRKYTAPHCESS